MGDSKTTHAEGTERYLTPGQWLGESNRIDRMIRFSTGWRMYDTTGAAYEEWQYPDGLKTWDVPTDGHTEAKRTPWPAKEV